MEPRKSREPRGIISKVVGGTPKGCPKDLLTCTKRVEKGKPHLLAQAHWPSWSAICLGDQRYFQPQVPANFRPLPPGPQCPRPMIWLSGDTTMMGVPFRFPETNLLVRIKTDRHCSWSTQNHLKAAPVYGWAFSPSSPSFARVFNLAYRQKKKKHEKF